MMGRQQNTYGVEQSMNKEQEWHRKQQAYDMRLRGKTYRVIADELGVGVGTVHRWVQEVLDSIVLPTVEAVRKQEVDRLMRYLDVLDTRIEDGDDKAVGLALKVSERLAKMLGVDMPTQVQVERTEVTQVDLAIRDLISSQAAKNRARLEAASHIRSSGDTPSHVDVSTDDMSTDYTSTDVVSTDELSVERIVFDN